MLFPTLLQSRIVCGYADQGADEGYLCRPGIKGDTATNTLKPATVESGATVRVPLFINEGETIEIDI